MPRTLAIPAFFRTSQMVGGVASYFQNLTRGMDEVIGGIERFRDLKVTFFHGTAGVPYRCPRFDYVETGDRGGRFGRQFAFGLGDSKAFDATLFPNYFRPPIVRSKRSAAVIHDLLYKHMPELASLPKRLWLDWAQRYTLQHCDRVITISHTVRTDILERFGSRWEDKLQAIWNPIAFERLEGDERQTITKGRPYLLAVAVDRPFKNLYTLIHAFHRLRSRFPDHVLVLAGELRSRRPKSKIHSAQVASEMPPTVDVVKQLGLEDHVLITGFISDQELGALYRGADAFVMPSLFEGFGMPAVESLALGTATVVSDIPVLREATQGFAHYLTRPRDPDVVAEQLGEVLDNPSSARPSSDKVSRIRQLFAPANIATQYLDAVFDSPPTSVATPLVPEPVAAH